MSKRTIHDAKSETDGSKVSANANSDTQPDDDVQPAKRRKLDCSIAQTPENNGANTLSAMANAADSAVSSIAQLAPSSVDSKHNASSSDPEPRHGSEAQTVDGTCSQLYDGEDTTPEFSDSDMAE